MLKMKAFLIRKKGLIIGVVFGSLIGFLYYKFIGCASGTCRITSNPINSTLYGGLMGGLMADFVGEIIFKFKKKR
jgi:phage shock protein E